MFTKTITLAGAELSSFLAAGGQTINPATLTTSTPAFNFGLPATTVSPILATTSAPAAFAAPIPTSSTRAAAATTTTSPASSSAAAAPASTAVASTPRSSAAVAASSSSSSPATTATTSSTTAAAAAVAPVVTQATPTTSAARRPVTASSRRVTSSAVPAAQIALNSGGSSTRTSTGAISGGGIAGLIIGLLLAAGLLAAGLIFLAKKRRDKRKAEYANEKSQRERRNEKGAMRLDEGNVGMHPGSGMTHGGGGGGAPGFNFGVLPAIAPAAPMSTTVGNYQRSASPAEMYRGAAVLGIQRPYTPPPGHPSHPNYMPAPAGRGGSSRSTTPGSQVSARNVSGAPGAAGQSRLRNMTPPMGSAQFPPSRPVASQNGGGNVPIVSPLPIYSANSQPFPFSSQNSSVVAPPLAREQAPVIPPLAAGMASASSRGVDAESGETLLQRASGQSFTPGDEAGSDSLSPKTTSTSTAAQGFATASHPFLSSAPPAPSVASGVGAAALPTTFERTRSVLQATDGWAQRKAQLKNTIASSLASASPGLGSAASSPAVDQSPFADPAPLIHQDISSAPMDLQFGHGGNAVSVR